VHHSKNELPMAKWVRSGGSGLVRRPSGLPSIADIPPRCRKPPQWADTVEKRFCEHLRAILIQDQPQMRNIDSRVRPT
jgi:hypothetical protein